MKRISSRNEHTGLIVQLAKLFQPEVYVEIGARNGDTFNLVSAHCAESYAIDIRLRHIKRRDTVNTFQMRSDEFSEVWKKLQKPIDLLFIDADHRKDAVLSDFLNFAKWVKEYTGLIIIHDTYPINERQMEKDRCSNSWEVAKWIRKQSEYEIVTLPGPTCGLSIARPAIKHGWMDNE